MVKHTLKILQQMLQDFKVSDHFTTLRSKGLNGSNEYWKEYVGSKTNEQISTLVLQENKAS